ncbi:MAG: FAD-dependent oxidoreductase [Deferribacteres bacterium]|nr:FAD-dependent oxidoreductase [candidate division KSB1 bacterium]MCB9502377.1 FAD-dependent oxidoreductase [Deferribacteres bacterium]
MAASTFVERDLFSNGRDPINTTYQHSISTGSHPQQSIYSVDICVYGGTASGVIAAYAAKKMGKSVLLVEPGKHLGGMVSGGLGRMDIPAKWAVSGLARDFFRRVGQHYGVFEKWVFEPHVAEKVFRNYVTEARIQVLYDFRIFKANMDETRLEHIELENTTEPFDVAHKIVNAEVFIDCSYEGDLMAKAGITYTFGRESNEKYTETFNGVQFSERNQFPKGVDPYIVAGDSSSGLLWGIDNDVLQENGSEDTHLQAYGYRICLTDDPNNLLPVSRPENYDSNRYELLVRYWQKRPIHRLDEGFSWGILPNRKTDINSRGPFSLNVIGQNKNYTEVDYFERAELEKLHKAYTQGLLYFYGHDVRVPEKIREEMKKWGYPKDEYVEDQHWSPQLYIRESRRMLGEYVATESNCRDEARVPDGIALAAYTIDSHHCRRIVVDGMIKNEGEVHFEEVKPWPISYRTITPRHEEAQNVLVPVCLSASHVAFGSIRIEPVFMALGQAAGIAAAIAIDDTLAVQTIDYQKIQDIMHNNPLLDGRKPEIVVDNQDSQVSHEGDWRVVADEFPYQYGNDVFLSADTTGESVVRFSASIANSGNYQVYLWCTNYEWEQGKYPIASKVKISVVNGGHRQSRIFTTAMIRNDWLPLGTAYFEKGQDAVVEIQSAKVPGVVVADAVLFVPD